MISLAISSKKRCLQCNSAQCNHCRCPGYIDCDHKPGEPCPRAKYNKRLVCNNCERRKKKRETIFNSVATLQGFSSFTLPDNSQFISTPLPQVTQFSFPSLVFDGSEKNPIPPVTFSKSFAQLSDEQIYELDNLVDDDIKDPTNNTMTSASSFEPYSNSDLSNSSLNDLADKNNSLKELLERTRSNNNNNDSFNNNNSVLPSVSPLSSQTNINSNISQIQPPLPPPSTATATASIINNTVSPICRRDYVHINIQHNKSPFAVIPIDRSNDRLSYIRDYISKKVTIPLERDYNFLTKSGYPISKESENEVLVYDNIITDETPHHTFNTTIKRDHLFIKYIDDEVNNMSKAVKRSRKDDDDDDDDDDDKHNKKIRKLDELFFSASAEKQQELAMKVLQLFNGNVNNSSGSGNYTSVAIEYIKCNNYRGLEYILMKGCDINQTDLEGNTLLHIACMYNNWNIVCLLLDTLFNNKSYLCGYLDIMKRNLKHQLAIELTTDNDIKQLLSLCYDRWRVIVLNTKIAEECLNSNCNINNLEESKDLLCDLVDNSFVAYNTQFIVEGTLVLNQQESDFIVDNKHNPIHKFEIWNKPVFYSVLNKDKDDKEENKLAKKMENTTISQPKFSIKPAAQPGKMFKIKPAAVRINSNDIVDNIKFDTCNEVPTAASRNPNRSKSKSKDSRSSSSSSDENM